MSNTKIPSPEDMFLNTPLYEIFLANEATRNQIWQIEDFRGPLDCYCPGCKTHSIFKLLELIPVLSGSKPPTRRLNDGIFEKRFPCSRNNHHELIFIFMVTKPKFLKIGQFPSIADLKIKDVQKYLPVLGETKLQELTRSIGLASHGVGIGAFVYLRRIFESLIEDAHALAKQEASWNEAEFQSSRVVERIKLLKDFLPVFLVDNALLYSILSKGIHELEENECLAYFTVVKTGIELILDEKLETKNKELKIDQARRDIRKLGGQLS